MPDYVQGGEFSPALLSIALVGPHGVGSICLPRPEARLISESHEVRVALHMCLIEKIFRNYLGGICRKRQVWDCGTTAPFRKMR